MKTKGSCLCGKVRFVIEGDFEHFFLCHCQHCRKDTGSAHAANLFSNSAKLTWLSGEDLVKTYQVPSTQHIKSFCSHCGSAVPNVQMDGRLTVVPAGSLDDDVPIQPDAHICVASKANLDEELDLIPKLEGMPGN